MSIYYDKIRIENGKTKDLHRYIMEKHIGKKLRTNQIVHHINGDIHDNRIENLQIMSRRDHARLHLCNRIVPEHQKDKMRLASAGKAKPYIRTVSDDQMRQALIFYGQGMRKREIEDKCGFDMGTLYAMMRGIGARYRELETEIKGAVEKRVSLR